MSWTNNPLLIEIPARSVCSRPGRDFAMQEAFLLNQPESVQITILPVYRKGRHGHQHMPHRDGQEILFLRYGAHGQQAQRQ